MSVERRKRGGVYYYRSTKVDGRVVKRYMGAGQAALLTESIDRQLREQERADRDERQTALRAFDDADRTIGDFCQRVEMMAQAALLGAGYHRHDRGEWRRRRGQQADDR